MRVLGIAGSLRRASHNRSLLRAAAELLPPEAELEVWDGLAAIPAYDEDLDQEGEPEPVAAMRRAFAEADAVLISTPEYNSSIPGALKNALDWASRPFPGNCLRNKPVAVMGTSTGLFGAVWSQGRRARSSRRSVRTCSRRSFPSAKPPAHSTQTEGSSIGTSGNCCASSCSRSCWRRRRPSSSHRLAEPLSVGRAD